MTPLRGLYQDWLNVLPALPRGGWEGGRDGDDVQSQPEAVLPPDGDTAINGCPVC